MLSLREVSLLCFQGAGTVLCRLLWVMYDPEHSNWQEGLPLDISKTLKRRYFLVEKAKNANVIGEFKKQNAHVLH